MYNILSQLLPQGVENEKQFISKNREEAIQSETTIYIHENPDSQTDGTV